MSKKRILFCGEATFLNTGYATYAREILNYFLSTGKYELAELANYGERNDPRAQNLKWKYYGVQPNQNCEPKASQEELNVYNSSPSNQFGEWIFEHACLDFKPHYVCSIADFWMCLTKDCNIVCTNKIKKIKDIEKGDKVLTHNGKYESVLRTFKRKYTGNLYTINAMNCPFDVKLTTDHPILCLKRNGQAKLPIDKFCKNNLKWIKSQDIEKNDIVVYPIDTDRVNEGKNTFNKDFCRLLGYYMSEGCILYRSPASNNNYTGVQFTLNSKENSYISDIENIINNLYEKETKVKVIGNTAILRCHSKKLAKDCIEFCGSLAGEKCLSDKLYYSNNLCIRSFLCGLFRGDGGYYNKRASYCTKSEQLAHQVFRLCIRLGILPSFNLNKNKISGIKKTYYRYIFSFRKNALEGFKSLYDDKLEKEIYPSRRIKDGYAWLTIRNVSSEKYEGDVYNFEVDVDNSYVSSFCLHNCDYVERSPFRQYFKHIWMPTVDARPQARQWIASYANTDACLSYSDWAGGILEDQSGGKINYIGSAPPSAHPAYQPIENKNAHKESLGIDPSFKIIGTVMRNQRRKLYPDLFIAFRRFLDQSEDKNFYLYCHTSYPDLGWDIPELLHQHELASHVLFTYICPETKNPFVSIFKGAIAQSPYTGKWGSTLSNVKNGLSYEDLCKVINCFDLYTQYHNCLLPNEEILIKRNNTEMWMPISEVKAGDLSWTHNSRWKKITHTHKNLKTSNGKDILNIEFCSDYKSLSTTSNHKFPAFTIKEFPQRNISSRVSIRERIGSYLRNNKDLPDFGKYELSELKPKDILLYSINDEVQDIKSINNYIDVDREFCRFLGLFAADGTWYQTESTNGIVVTSSSLEEENHKLCRKVLSKIGPTHKVAEYYYTDRNAIDIGIWSKEISNIFSEWFKKHEDKQLPDWCLRLPIEKQKEILIGYFMGDGHFDEKNNLSIVSTISYKLSEQIREILLRLRINFSLKKVIRSNHKNTDNKNRKDTYRFEIYGMNIKDGDIKKIYRRTQNIFYKNYYLMQVKNISKINYNGDVYCITVEEDNTMTTRRCTTFQSEGFGLPLVEAAACGVPVCGTDYSAPESIIRKLGGYPIKPATHYKELETGCLRAVPDNFEAVKVWKKFFELGENERIVKGQETRKCFDKYYQWDKSGKVWEKAFGQIGIVPEASSWLSPPKLHKPEPKPDPVPQVTFTQMAKWLIVRVLGDPSKLNSFFEARLTRDLMYKSATGSTGGMYFNESSAAFSGSNHRSDFNFDIAYDQMVNMCNKRNMWEQKRIQVLGVKG